MPLLSDDVLSDRTWSTKIISVRDKCLSTWVAQMQAH